MIAYILTFIAGGVVALVAAHAIGKFFRAGES